MYKFIHTYSPLRLSAVNKLFWLFIAVGILLASNRGGSLLEVSSNGEILATPSLGTANVQLP
jgi:hypothetical protein